MASSFSSSVHRSAPPNSEDPNHNLRKQIRGHEIAIAELNNLSSSRAVYQKNGSIYFRTSIKEATASVQRQLDLDKDQLKKLNSD